MSKISLITSTLGRQDVLTRLLRSLEGQTHRDFEVIVVDQNDPGFLDNVLTPFSSKLNLIHIRSPKGLSRGRNAALPLASGDIIGFPDDDCWYRPETLAQIADLSDEYPKHGLLVGRTTDERGVNSIVPSLAHDCDIDRQSVIDAANSNTIFVRREPARAIGPFDERFGVGAATPFQGAEDRDYLARALAIGVKCRFVHDLTIFHEQIDALGGNHLSRVKKYALGDGAYYRKHRYGLGRILLMSAKALGGIPFRLMRGQAPQIRFKLAYCGALFSGFMTWKDTPQESRT